MFEDLKLSHVDYTSGIILLYYKQYISDDRVDVADTIGKKATPEVWAQLRIIDDQVNQLK